MMWKPRRRAIEGEDNPRSCAPPLTLEGRAILPYLAARAQHRGFGVARFLEKRAMAENEKSLRRRFFCFGPAEGFTFYTSNFSLKRATPPEIGKKIFETPRRQDAKEGGNEPNAGNGRSAEHTEKAEEDCL